MFYVPGQGGFVWQLDSFVYAAAGVYLQCSSANIMFYYWFVDGHEEPLFSRLAREILLLLLDK